MIIGAGFGHVMGVSPNSHSFAERAEQRFSGAIFGALCGFAVELVIRQFLPIPENIPSLRFSLRTLLIVVTYISILFGLVVYLIK